MSDIRPIIMWFRRDLRLADHAALTQAAESGRPVIPLFILDEVTQAQGAAARFRLGLSVASLQSQLASVSSKLILRRGSAKDVLRDVVAQTGAGAVYWSRLYDPQSKARDTDVKADLKIAGIDAQSFAGHVLFEPWTVETKTGGYYRVYSPMWKNVRDWELPVCLPRPATLTAPDDWPQSDALDNWQMGADMDRGAGILAQHCVVGEDKALTRLHAFIEDRVHAYKRTRDLPSIKGTSGLSENLTYGEISPLTCWHAGWAALHAGKSEAEVFLKELVWREFAYHLAHHSPEITTRNWKPGWDNFPWNTDENHPDVIAWKQGRTGIQFVDAAMREMYVTGVMHNRGRMIVASYLTKHLMTDWKIGMAWFDDCLIDWDPCSNAMGWQWAAGSGPDAAPYFRVFNPVSQLDKFDPQRDYPKRWIAEGRSAPSKDALAYFDAIPISWGLRPDAKYPDPIVAVDVGRARALEAYSAREF